MSSAPLGRVVLAHEPSFTLGTLNVIPATRQVETASRSELIEPRVMRVLVALARAGGAIVTRDELIERCWDGQIVSDDAIGRPLAQIRQMAAGIGEGSFTIETITKVGYRLLAQHNDGAQSDRVLRAGAHFPQGWLSRRASIAGGFAVGAVTVAGAGGWLWLRPRAAQANRIAVMPFANLSGEANQAYFAEGFTEELRSALSRIGMEVIGRSSSVSVKDLDTRAAAEKLGVANILTGSVRRSPDVVRITAQLISGKDGVERWAQSYDRVPGDAIKIQADIAANVADAMSVVLGQAARAALTLGGTADSIAQDLFLQARQLRRSSTQGEDLMKSLALCEAAIARDANYPLANVEKATLLIILAMNHSDSLKQTTNRIALADRAAKRALKVAPTLGVAHLAMFAVEQARINFALALEYFRRAVALSPDDPDVLFFGPGILALLGEGQEATRLADRFIRLDPLNPQAYQGKANVLMVLRQYPDAIEMVRKVLEMRPEATDLNGTIGFGLLLMNRPEEARVAFRLVSKGSVLRLLGEALLAARTGDGERARKLASELKKRYEIYHFQQAIISAQLGDKEAAFASLDRSLAARDNSLMGLKKNPFLDPLRSDPRFGKLVSKLNFPS